MTQKSVQIDTELFLKLVRYFNYENDKNALEELHGEISGALSDKVDKMVSRMIFSKYKREPQGEERERLRLEYLNKIGISESLRTDKETPFTDI